MCLVIYYQCYTSPQAPAEIKSNLCMVSNTDENIVCAPLPAEINWQKNPQRVVKLMHSLNQSIIPFCLGHSS